MIFRLAFFIFLIWHLGFCVFVYYYISIENASIYNDETLGTKDTFFLNLIKFKCQTQEYLIMINNMFNYWNLLSWKETGSYFPLSTEYIREYTCLVLVADSDFLVFLLQIRSERFCWENETLLLTEDMFHFYETQ